jgi:hypothetical protein
METPPYTSHRERILQWVGLLFFAFGIMAAVYCLYDLKYPSHFVGDMYGIEVLARLSWVCGTATPMFIGTVLLFLDRQRIARRRRWLGMAFVIVPSVILLAMAVYVVQSRHLDEIRKSYPEKSIDELLSIAKERKDQHAIYPLITRADPAAVPGLAEILLDANEPGNLRSCAAEALGRIGNEEARKALVKARDSSSDQYFKEHVVRILDNARSRPQN